MKRDLGIIFLSIILGILLAKSGALGQLLDASRSLGFFGSFIAGVFFTSLFTTFPAAVVLGELAQVQPVFVVALLGGAGAVVGDLIIFKFVRDNIVEDFSHLISKRGRARVRAIFDRRLFRWLTPLVGALIIASPLPDELGLAMLGISGARMSVFIPLSFALNFLGILAIGLIARNLL